MSQSSRSPDLSPAGSLSSAGQPLMLQTMGMSAPPAPSSSSEGQVLPLILLASTGLATQSPESQTSPGGHSPTPSEPSSRSTDPGAWSPDSHLSERWDDQSPPHQPRAPDPRSQDASVFLGGMSRPRIHPRMRPIPTDDQESPAPQAPAQHPVQPPFVDLTRASQLSASMAPPSQPAPSVPASALPDSGSVIDFTHSDQSTPRAGPIDSGANPSVHLTRTDSGRLMQAHEVSRMKSGRPVFSTQEYRITSSGTLMPFVKLSSGTASAATPASAASPAAAADTTSLAPMEIVLDFTKDTPQASEGLAPSTSKAAKPRTTKGTKGTKPAPAPKPAARNPNATAKPPAKRARTSKNVEAAAAALGEREKAALDIPLESESDVEMDDEETQGDNNNNGATRRSKHFPEDVKMQVLTWWFDPETYKTHRENKLESIKQLLVILKGAMTKRQVTDFLKTALTRYHTYNRLAMKTGGGKDDRITRDEMEACYHRGRGDKYKFEYWMNYGDSNEFNIIHEVLWDSEDVRKFKHLDSVTSIFSDNDSDKEPVTNDVLGPSKSKDKGKGQSRKRTRGSGSETEREHGTATGEDGIVAVKILGGIDGLVATRHRHLGILERQLELDTQKAANEQANQLTRITNETWSSQIADFMHISQVITSGAGNQQVLAHAQTLLSRLSLELNLAPPPVAAASSATPHVTAPASQPAASASSPSTQAGPSSQPTAPHSAGSQGLSMQAGASAPGPSNLSTS